MLKTILNDSELFGTSGRKSPKSTEILAQKMAKVRSMARGVLITDQKSDATVSEKPSNDSWSFRGSKLSSDYRYIRLTRA